MKKPNAQLLVLTAHNLAKAERELAKIEKEVNKILIEKLEKDYLIKAFSLYLQLSFIKTAAIDGKFADTEFEIIKFVANFMDADLFKTYYKQEDTKKLPMSWDEIKKLVDETDEFVPMLTEYADYFEFRFKDLFDELVEYLSIYQGMESNVIKVSKENIFDIDYLSENVFKPVLSSLFDSMINLQIIVSLVDEGDFETEEILATNKFAVDKILAPVVESLLERGEIEIID